MPKSFIISFFFLICIRATAQVDSLLATRLNMMFSYYEVKDFDKVLDYMYPKLFTLISRELMLESLKSYFDPEEFSMSFDSLTITKIYPVFIVEDESFTKITHSVRMKMELKELADTTYPMTFDEIQELIKFMEAEFGEGNVRYDKSGDAIISSTTEELIAIKTREDNQWYFVNYEEDSLKRLKLLFSTPVLEKLETYK